MASYRVSEVGVGGGGGISLAEIPRREGSPLKMAVVLQ